VDKVNHKVNEEDPIQQNVPAMGMVAEIELERNQVAANAKAEVVEKTVNRPIISFGGDGDDSFVDDSFVVEDYALSHYVDMIRDLRDRLSLEDYTI
jgi:hypothetical protein